MVNSTFSKTHTKGEIEMLDNIVDVAGNFVDLVLKYEQWCQVEALPADEIRILFNIVSNAGFNPKEIVPGKLFSHYCDEDGRSTSETYPINILCPFKVVDQKNGDHYFATGWLDCALRRVVYGIKRQGERREKLIDVIAEEIKRSVPLGPIRISRHGDLLHERPPRALAFTGLDYFVNHTRDGDNLNDCVGIHAFCNSRMNRVPSTASHDAIVCQRCNLRVLFPKEVNTYGDLRQELGFENIGRFFHS